MRRDSTPAAPEVHASTVRIRAGVELVAAIGLVVVAAAAYLSSGWMGQQSVAVKTSEPPRSSETHPSIPEPDPTVPGCRPDDIDAVIASWERQADRRVAVVQMNNTSGRTCEVWATSTAGLYAGSGDLLIQGPEGSADATVTSGPGIVLWTTVSVENYCGPEPQPGVTLAFLEDDGFYVATALSRRDRSGVPPCIDRSVEGSIVMSAWTPTGG